MNLKRKLWWAQHRADVYKYLTIFLLILIVIVSIIYFTYSKFSSSNEVTAYETTVEPFIKNDYFIASYIDGEWSNEIPGKDDGYVVDKIICDNGAVGTWDSDTWSINISNATQKIKCSIYFKYQFEQVFDYTGGEQVFTVPKTGTYKIETWGAQGGSAYEYYGGYGGHAGGYIGNSGIMSAPCTSDILCHVVGSGGTQTSGGTSYEETMAAGFGYGGLANTSNVGGAGGGSGYYGGGGSYDNAGGGGGSGYIGNSLLINKAMYCYNCEESSEGSTKTISTTCAEETPTENCAKKGNGYARITYVG